MSKNIVLDSLFGSDEDAPIYEETAESRVEASAVAVSVALGQTQNDRNVTEAAAEFLRQQTSFLKEQARLLGDEQPFRVANLRSQAQEHNIRRVGQQFRVGVQAFTILIMTIVTFGFFVLLYDAFTSRSVVVNAFKAPPTLSGRGITGEVVAQDVLDTLNKLQDATQTPSKGLEVRRAWAGDIKIEVPQTGISISEINRLLHERFGHDLHIDGDLVQTETGALMLTVRGDGVPATTFRGDAGDLEKLTGRASEYVYSRSQPWEFAIYLENSNRNQEALDFLPGAFARALGDSERANLANAWGNAYLVLLHPDEAAEKYRLVMTLSPPRSKSWWKGLSNLVVATCQAQGEEAAWKAAQVFFQAASVATKSEQPEMRLKTAPAVIIWDVPLILASSLADISNRGGARTTIDGPQIAEGYALAHNPAGSALYMAVSDASDPTTKAEALMLRGYAALDAGNAAGAVAVFSQFDALWRSSAGLQALTPDQPCFLGLAYGLSGQKAKSEAVFNRISSPWSRCYGFHGEALARSGDVAAGKRVWAEGERLLPDLPNVYLARGRWEMDQNDLKAAEDDLTIAAEKAPHFADPLKALGDLMAKAGRVKAALIQYDAALKFAPNWSALRQARDAAAKKT